jgi:glycosyltransferase involved in cell wall biosynthesis
MLIANPNALISVIIPVYNGAMFLAAALESVLGQTYQTVEIVVVDDGSTDDTVAVVRQFGNAVCYLYQPNGGPAAARNTGIAAATGEFIAFLDHDDQWTPAKLTLQANYLQQNPQIGYVLARMHVMLELGVTWPATLNRAYYAQDPVGVVLSAMVVRRSVFDQVGYFDSTLPQAEDVDWFARAQDLDVQKAVIDAVLLYKRIHGGNISLKAQENTKNLFQVLRRSTQRKQAVS